MLLYTEKHRGCAVDGRFDLFLSLLRRCYESNNNDINIEIACMDYCDWCSALEVSAMVLKYRVRMSGCGLQVRILVLEEQKSQP
jgi:hypothetical protein